MLHEYLWYILRVCPLCTAHRNLYVFVLTDAVTADYEAATTQQRAAKSSGAFDSNDVNAAESRYIDTLATLLDELPPANKVCAVMGANNVGMRCCCADVHVGIGGNSSIVSVARWRALCSQQDDTCKPCHRVW